MTDRLTATSYAVLGLLSRRDHPISGYEFTAFADRTIGYFWSIPRSVLYKELARLEALGHVAGTVVTQQRLPDKRLFELTDSGRAALDEWLAGPDLPSTRPKNGFLLKLFLAHRMSPEALAELLAAERHAAEQQVTDLGAVADRLADRPQSVFGRLTALYGLHQAQARLRWLADADDLLSERSAGRTSHHRKENDR